MEERDESRNANQHLGMRIRARREELGLSLRDVARETGLSATFISQLERGTANPTLASLRSIANALKLPIYQLVGEPPNHAPVVRRERRARMSFPPHNVTYEILTPELTRNMVLFEVLAQPEAGNLVRQPFGQPGEECIVVLEGVLEVVVAGEAYELSAGDSIYFQNQYLESIRALDDAPARYLSAISRVSR